MMKINLDKRRLTLTLLSFLLFSAMSLYGQITITGKIVSATDNLPLPGVNVLIKGTNTGTISDVDGNYTLQVPDNTAVLEFSMMGMLTESIPVDNRTTIDVSMSEDLVGLDEVIVVGYGTMKKSEVSGAIASVGIEEMTEVKSANVFESLQGKMAGVDITLDGGMAGSGVNIRVRGDRSLTASNEPLYVVDGIPYGSSLDLSPNDIQSIEVLKDASSTAIYGSRGANGVILVTTKKGQAGTSKIYFNSYYGVTQPYQNIPVFDAEGYIKAKRDSYRTLEDWDNLTTSDESIFSVTERAGIARGTNTNWQDICTHNGTRQEYHLGVMGGKDNMTYNTSLSYFNEDGITLADKFKRYTYRLNMDSKVTKWLKVGGSLVLVYSEHDGRGVRFTDAVLLSPIVECFDSATGDYIFQPDLSNPRRNPLLYTDDKQEDIRANILSSVYGQVNFTPNLYVRSNLGVDLNNEREGYMYPQTDPNDDITTAGVNLDNSFNYTWTNLLNYAKEISVHSFTLTLGHEIQYNKKESYTMYGESQPFLDNDWWNMGSVNSGTNQATSYFMKKGLVSAFARLSYNYNDLILLNGTGRYDGASQLTEGNKWDFFPSASAAIRLSNLDFMKSVQTISDLKFRVGYGVAGNAAVDAYATKGIVNESPMHYQFGEPGAEVDLNGYRPQFLASESLKWETTTQYNIGLDFGLFNNRLSGNLDVFKSHTTDLLLPSRLPLNTGFFEIMTNVGETEVKGLELMLQSYVIKTANFGWDLNLSFTATKDKILALASGLDQDIANGWFVGQPIKSIYDYDKVGIWQLDEAEEAAVYGQFPGDIHVRDIVQTNDSTYISADDQTIIGNETPKWSGSLVNTFSFKGFDLTLNIYARIGHTINAAAYGFDPRMYDNMLAVDYWTPYNPTNDYPRFRRGAAELDFENTLRYRDGSYIKLKNITFGWTMPSKWVESARISKARIYVTSNNPLILMSKLEKGIDPERNGSISWPLARTVIFGVNLEF